MPRHLLIAAATSSYPHMKPGDQRPQLDAVLASVVKLFTETLGSYQRELDAIAVNPPSELLRKNLGKWFGAEDRDPADWVVFYYTGHAEVVGSDSLYLLTSDFEPGDLIGTAFPMGLVADAVMGSRRSGRPPRVRNLLVIVDTCFGGEGAVELVSRLEDVFRKSSGSSFYMLGAALPRQEAQAGALAKALIESIADLSRRNVTQEWIFFDQILPAINQRLRVHDAILSMVSSTRDVQQFFPNPSFVRAAGNAVQADDAQRAISDQEFREHWGPRARGVEFDAQPGSYFFGRGSVLGTLTAFLNSATDNRTHVVTGRPGSGKSAILSRLVTGSLPGHGGVPIELAIHAKGKTLEDVVRRVAGAVDAEATTSAVLDRLKRSARPIRVVVDALDEASQPVEIAGQLLQPLNAMESVKLVVGTRGGYLAALGSAEVIDIDRPEHARKEDIAQYVRARLMRANEPPQPTPYAGKEALAARVADMVAEGAYPNFLVARLVVEDLLSRPKPVNPRAPGAMDFPTKVSAAFDAYLARFGEKEAAVRNLLLPLAYAEGQGLPWDNIWAPMASALSGVKYGDDDVRWLLANAGAFILETTEDGCSVYRLYHQALGDALRKGRNRRAVERTFVNVLVSSAPKSPATRDPNWLLASRYARAHLATHAGRCGKLGELLGDPLYLLAARAGRLLRAIAENRGDLPGQLVSFYRSAVHIIREQPVGIAAAHMELIARQRGLTALADRIGALPVGLLWRTPWAQWSPASPSQSFGKGASEIRVLEIADCGTDVKVALIGRHNGDAEIWDIASGERLLHWPVREFGAVGGLALTSPDLGPLLMAAWNGGHMGRYDLATGEFAGRRVEGGPRGAVTSLCFASSEGRPVWITAHEDRRLVVRDVRTLAPLGEKASLDMAKIYDLCPVEHNGESLLWTAGDSARAREPDDPSKLRLWRLRDLSVLWEDARGEGGCFLHLGPVSLWGHHLAVISQEGFDTWEIWDLEQRRMLLRGAQRTSRSWIHKFRGDTLLIGANPGELTAARLAGKKSGKSLALTESPLDGRIEIRGDRFTGIFPLHGRATVLSAWLDHVRVWDLDELLDEAFRVGGPKPAAAEPCLGKTPSLTFLKGEPDRLFASAVDRVVALDANRGSVLWSRTRSAGRFGDVSTIAEQKLVLAVDGTRAVHVLSMDSGEEVRPAIQTGSEIESMRALRWRRQNLLFVTAQSGSDWAARVWDVDTGQEIPTSLAYQLYSGEQDKTMEGLAVCATEECVRLAFSSSYGKVMVANFTGPIDRRHIWPEQFDTWHVPAAGGEYVRCLATGTDNGEALLAAGTADGHLAIWNFMDGEVLASRASAHVEAVRALSFGTIDGQAVLASGGHDGALCLWSSAFEALFRIEIGEAILTIEWLGPNRLAVGTSRGVLQLGWPVRPV